MHSGALLVDRGRVKPDPKGLEARGGLRAGVQGGAQKASVSIAPQCPGAYCIHGTIRQNPSFSLPHLPTPRLTTLPAKVRGRVEHRIKKFVLLLQQNNYAMPVYFQNKPIRS